MRSGLSILKAPIRTPSLTQAHTRALGIMATQSPTLTIEVVSDTVCPWCYVGKKRLEQAIDLYKGRLNVEVHWLPFQLNPASSKKGINKLQMYREKFGGQVDSIIPRMTQTFAELGLKYSIGGDTGNTLDSHRVLRWAHESAGWQAQNALAEELFSAYMCNEKCISSHEVLLEAVSKVKGLDLEAARALLADDNTGLAETEKELARGRAMGVSGVPYFVIQQYKVSGAQPVEVFTKMFDEYLRTAVTPTGSVEGAVCAPGEKC
mmetsp:Transcript_9298/g.16435  ORF Transcript_9298/g.16435 Transcript_9298/m.16435 type:complete len:263 (+) Transcript_9298:5-793(+)